MRRTAIAAAWIVGATVPLLASVVMIFGCCVLPFHNVIHRVFPCNLAMSFIHGEHHPTNGQRPLPARQKQEPPKRIVTEFPRKFPLHVASMAERRPSMNDAAGYRSFISLGAVRCDRDVGLHVYVRALLI